MPEFSRRSFMKHSGMTVAAAAMAAPVIPLLTATSSEAPEIEGDASGAAAESTAGVTASSSGLAQPLVAQVKNAATGEISIYSGEQEITYQDRDMAARLLQAAGKARP
jgi:hypothetical protein